MWYIPYSIKKYGTMKNQIENLLEHDLTKKQIYDILLNRYKKRILKDNRNLKFVSKSVAKNLLEKNKNDIVAFKIFFCTDSKDRFYDADFHFRIYLKDKRKWKEKIGGDPPQDSESGMLDDWNGDDCLYDSKTLFFLRK